MFEKFGSSSPETRRYLTPYAFSVDQQLLGLPLASPSKRFWGMFIDLLIVLSLSIISAKNMAICIILLSLYAAATNSGIGRPIAILICAAAIAFIVIASSLDKASMPTDNSATISQSEVKTVNEDDLSSDLGFFEWLDQKGLELGLGIGWAALYFTAVTALFQGRSVGKIVTGTRVQKIDGSKLSWWECFERYGGYSAGLATGLLGFFQVYWDANRQAIHDKVSETVVIDTRRIPRNLENAKAS